KLKQAIAAAAQEAGSANRVPFPDAFEREVVALHNSLNDGVPLFLLRRLLLDVGGYTERRFVDRFGNGMSCQVQTARQRLAEPGCPVPAVEARTRDPWIRAALVGCIQRPRQRPLTWTDRLDHVLTHRVWGTLVFLALMFVVFQSIFSWARPVMKVIS